MGCEVEVRRRSGLVREDRFGRSRIRWTADHSVPAGVADHPSRVCSKNLTTCSGFPRNFARSSGFWVAIPGRAGIEVTLSCHVAAERRRERPCRRRTRRHREGRQLRTSRAVARPPSVRRRTRSRMPFCMSTCWASARPSSHGLPAYLMLESAAAPVPPVCAGNDDEVGVCLGHALRLPCRRRSSETSFTPIAAAFGLTRFRS